MSWDAWADHCEMLGADGPEIEGAICGTDGNVWASHIDRVDPEGNVRFAEVF